MFRLDPLRFPNKLIAPDPAADGGCREIGISRKGVELRRSIRRVSMHLKISFQEYAGVAVRVLALGGNEPEIYLTLDHRDEALSVLVGVFDDSVETAIAARKWSRFTGRPVLIADCDGRLRTPSAASKRVGFGPRRKRRSALRNRRTAVRARFERSASHVEKKTYPGEREIIART